VFCIILDLSNVLAVDCCGGLVVIRIVREELNQKQKEVLLLKHLTENVNQRVEQEC